MSLHAGLLLRHARVITLDGAGWGEIADGAVAVAGGRVLWVGADAALPADLTAVEERDLGGALLTPGLIDCHTHLVYAGDRYREFEQRLEGASYQAIARAGGGIRATVAATRAAGPQALFTQSLPRLAGLRAEGVTTVEIKSGYGLDLVTERRMLQVARRLGDETGIGVRTSFLGAHAVPTEFDGRADAYIDWLAAEVLPTLAAEGLVDAVDGFCETIGFSRAQMARLFDTAAALGLPVKLHAEQLSNQRAAELVADRGGLSADHLEWLSAEGVAAMAAAGSVAVLLPGAYYFLRETRLPPIGALRAAGVPLAVATDMNPGSAPLGSLLAALNMACTLFRLTPAEAVHGATTAAARALGLSDRGRIGVGLRADLAVWALDHPAGLVAHIGHNPLIASYVAGVLLHER